MHTLSLKLTAFFLSLFVCVLQAATIRVPADFETIQVAIYTAIDGDTVLVADGTYSGTYNRDIQFMGKTIVVMSENGPENCIIDCHANILNPHRGFLFRGGENANAVLQGFTITRGCTDGENGAAIVCTNSSSPTMINNIIIDNFVFEAGGGGISCHQSSPRIIDNYIIDNFASEGGGGISMSASSPLISHNIIAGNGTSYDGGGILCVASSPDIISNTIFGNSASRGGGIFTQFGNHPELLNCILWKNDPNQINPAHPIDVTYSDVQGGYLGEGNINEPPRFVSPNRNDYRLLWSSPCIDTGHPDSLDKDGTRVDIGRFSFNQDDYLTLYMTPDTKEVRQGGRLGVTYTLINRWDWAQPAWGQTQAILPGGMIVDIIGPDQDTLPPDSRVSRHFNRHIPTAAPFGIYEYWAGLGIPPSILSDEDSFTFRVVE